MMTIMMLMQSQGGAATFYWGQHFIGDGGSRCRSETMRGGSDIGPVSRDWVDCDWLAAENRFWGISPVPANNTA